MIQEGKKLRAIGDGKKHVDLKIKGVRWKCPERNIKLQNRDFWRNYAGTFPNDVLINSPSFSMVFSNIAQVSTCVNH